MAEIHDLINERYRLDACLGEGAMGIVYRAHDALLNRDVALKILRDQSLNPESRLRLLHEAQAVARLNHPNIVTVHDAGETDGEPFFVMELLQGVTLREYSPQDELEVIAIAVQVCAALEHAHQHGIIHRDLKPENIFLVSKDNPMGGDEHPSGPQVKLVDFGIARSVTSRLTAEGSLVGTVFYLAPEQALGQPIDGRTDLYALGVILYELTTGRLPFTGDDPLAVISQHLYAPLVPPRAYNQKLTPELDVLIGQLLSKQPDGRPASAQEVEQRLTNILERSEAVPLVSSPGLESAEPVRSPESALLDLIARRRLVGRGDELVQLREHWLKASQGAGHLVLLSGEPGVGKTRLAEEMIAYTRLQGARVLQGGCYEYEATTSYLPLAEGLRDWVHTQSDEALRLHPTALLAELARLAPEIEARLGFLPSNPSLSPEQERLRFFDHFARFLEELSRASGLLLFIDDLHWVDRGTLALLHYLLRRLRSERILVLGAYREVELDRTHPLASSLVDWQREHLVTRIKLDRLREQDCAALLASMFAQVEVSEEFTQAIYRETEGNPFFIEEVVKALVEAGQIYRQDGDWQRSAVSELAIPQSIKEAIGRRLDRLDVKQIEVLQYAAGLGKTFRFAELSAALVEVGEDLLLDTLDASLAAQLIQASSQDAFTFTHDKIREVLYEEQNPIRRRRMHQRLGEGLEDLYQNGESAAHIQDLAYHFVQSGDLPRGLKYSLQAARRAKSLYALEDALAYYQSGLSCAEGPGLDGQLVDIHEAIGQVQHIRGFEYQAVESFQKALALAEAPARQASLKVGIGIAYGTVGDQRGRAYLEAARQELDPNTQVEELATTLGMLGRFCHYDGQLFQAIEYYGRARELAEPADRPETLTDIYSFLAGAYQHLARFQESMDWARTCIALGEKHNYPMARALGYEFLGEDNSLIGRWPDAMKNAELDHQIGEQVGAQDRVVWSQFPRVFALHGLGDLIAARDYSQAALQLAEQIGEKRLAIWLGAWLGKTQYDLGEAETAWQNAAQALERADDLGQAALQSYCRSIAAMILLRQGERDRALAMCLEAVELYRHTNLRMAALYLEDTLAQAYLANGQFQEADQVLEGLMELCQSAECLSIEGVAWRVRGQLHAAQGNWTEAENAFHLAIDRHRKLGSRLELARAYFHFAGFQQLRGLESDARQSFANALELFDACHAQPEAASCRAQLG